AEALEIYRREGMYIDAVVTDLAMPRLNGLRLISELRALDPRVTILAASGRNADQLDLAEDAGVAAVFYKPWDPSRFLRTLESLLPTTQTDGRPLPEWAFRRASS
ncbi:MAG: response regulator, partial [Longimicrobiales bacterium]